MRTARARTSGENLFVVLLMMAPPRLKVWNPPANPVWLRAYSLINRRLDVWVAYNFLQKGLGAMTWLSAVSLPPNKISVHAREELESSVAWLLATAGSL